jgi:hypothetical protein
MLTSMNLLGLFQRGKSAAQLRRETQPLMLLGLLVMLASGSLIFTGGAEAYFAGYWFRLKMTLLLTALIFQVTVYQIVARADANRLPRIAYRVTGLAMVFLWFSVACAGRAIAFFQN